MLRNLIMGTIIVLLVTGLAIVSDSSAAPPMQETAAETPTVIPTPTPGFSAALVGQANLSVLPSAPALLRVVSINVPGGTETEPAHYVGPVLILVQNGTVLLDADGAIVGSPGPGDGFLQPITPTPSEARGVPIARGFQALISPGSRLVLRNPTESAATVLMVLLEPEATSVSGTPTPLS